MNNVNGTAIYQGKTKTKKKLFKNEKKKHASMHRVDSLQAFRFVHALNPTPTFSLYRCNSSKIFQFHKNHLQNA